ncbi:hypothetical protein AWM75_07765 [Aerococcus urinaehominis]|uniref:Uncharacterized protein n=1 Tax=Aerococcus urinaehominis TaxID=128944 RepID=A0A0X8FM58_9LACT|nr:glycosyltransferase family 4 protein [Aerococcus urinaehominis]AMB99868.1 hypothetical protein AWM75_07765 [Aerococcus urinaehominis]SDM54328.1 Glycosyltransferase involved in cell wall bisynthesis [Aerococcus urinaehominis]
MKRALIYASVASMIDLFNMENIKILQNLGYQVDVACNFDEGSITSDERVEEFKRELDDMGIIYYNIPIPRSISKLTQINKAYQLTRELTKNDYDIVHCHSPIGSVICRLAFRNDDCRMIYTAHGFHFFDGAPKKNWLLFYPIEKFCARYTDTLITINNEDYQRAKEDFKQAGEVVHINGIGIDTSKFSKKEISRDSLLKDYDITDSDFVITSVGQLSVRKNHEVIIKAIKQISNAKIKYLIIGEGELREYLENLINELDLTNQVFLLGYRGNVSEYLSLSDCYAFPSLQEGLPASLMEAMSIGLPCVVSDIRGNNDLIDDTLGGYMCDAKNAKCYTKSLESLIYRPTEAYQIGQYNIKKIKSFSIVVVNSEMKQIYYDNKDAF